MKKSTRAIQDLMDEYDRGPSKIDGSQDFTKKQKSYVVSKFIEEEPAEELLEHIIDHWTPKEISSLVSKLYSIDINDKDKLLKTALQLKQIATKTLNEHYDDAIDDVISDYRFDQTENDLADLSMSKRIDRLTSIETPYGPKFTLGGY